MLYQLSYASKSPVTKLNISRTAGYVQLTGGDSKLNSSSDLRFFHTERTEVSQGRSCTDLCVAPCVLCVDAAHDKIGK